MPATLLRNLQIHPSVNPLPRLFQGSGTYFAINHQLRAHLKNDLHARDYIDGVVKDFMNQWKEMSVEALDAENRTQLENMVSRLDTIAPLEGCIRLPAKNVNGRNIMVTIGPVQVGTQSEYVRILRLLEHMKLLASTTEGAMADVLNKFTAQITRIQNKIVAMRENTELSDLKILAAPIKILGDVIKNMPPPLRGLLGPMLEQVGKLIPNLPNVQHQAHMEKAPSLSRSAFMLNAPLIMVSKANAPPTATIQSRPSIIFQVTQRVRSAVVTAATVSATLAPTAPIQAAISSAPVTQTEMKAHTVAAVSSAVTAAQEVAPTSSQPATVIIHASAEKTPDANSPIQQEAKVLEIEKRPETSEAKPVEAAELKETNLQRTEQKTELSLKPQEENKAPLETSSDEPISTPSVHEKKSDATLPPEIIAKEADHAESALPEPPKEVHKKSFAQETRKEIREKTLSENEPPKRTSPDIPAKKNQAETPSERIKTEFRENKDIVCERCGGACKGHNAESQQSNKGLTLDLGLGEKQDIEKKFAEAAKDIVCPICGPNCRGHDAKSEQRHPHAAAQLNLV